MLVTFSHTITMTVLSAPDSNQDIIKCGSYTGNGSSTGPSVNLGFEPQWVMVKNADTNGYGWIISDVMRGV